MTTKSTIRCAIYTRKSSEEGLDQEFNSLEAQREACEAYIKSQTHEGWRVAAERFDDGGHSGGTMERPALQCLLENVQKRRIDIIVIYKIDRLTRSLADFARLAELFDKHDVSIVSVTQQFNTTTSMGRLMLNVLLSFAQFEREITGERIRDKIAASKKKGMWMGGNVPIGYDVHDRALVVNKIEAETVRTIYRLYLEQGNVRRVVAEVNQLGLKTKVRAETNGRHRGGVHFFAGHIYHILKNPVYVGRTRHWDQTFQGAHEPIINLETWEATQRQIAGNRTGEHKRPNAREPSPLAGLIVDNEGTRFTPSHSVKAGRRYRYYVERSVITGDQSKGVGLQRIPAREIEDVVRNSLAGLLDNPARLLEALGDGLEAAEADGAIRRAEALRRGLLDPAPATWIVHIRTILRQVVLDKGAVRLSISPNGLRSALSLPMRKNSQPTDNGDDGTVAELYDFVIPARIRTRGSQIKLVIEGEGNPVQREQDTALIKAVTRALDWFDKLKNGDVTSIREIASAERVTGSYVSRVLRLAFLAPDIVEAILDGRYPIEFTTKRLLLIENLPLDWREQRRRLGFNPG